MEGQSLGNYRILKKLGEGGMGSVYLAKDITLEREVAIKIISPQLTKNPRLMARFKVEAIAQARLNHANIVTIHAFDQQQDSYYIVMEYIEGQTLKSIIKESGKIPLPQALSIVSRILDGLNYAHSRGVLHRDIKPANIFITCHGQIKIGDFGIAKVEGIDGLTRIGSPLGTPLYSAPEQILGQPVDAAADVYSIGVTLYEMLTGATPFKSPTGSHFEIQKAHLEQIPPKPSELSPTIPKPIDELIMKALAKNPAQRFPNASALKEALDKWFDGHAVSIEFSPPKGSPAPFKKPKGIKLPRPFLSLPKLKKLPHIHLPSLNFLKVKMPDIKPSISPSANVVQEKVLKSIKTCDKRKLLLIFILIPLLILLFIAIAYSESNLPIGYNPKYQNNQNNQNNKNHLNNQKNQNNKTNQTIHNNEFIIKFQEKFSSFSSSPTFQEE